MTLEDRQAKWEQRQRIKRKARQGVHFLDIIREEKLTEVEGALALAEAFEEAGQPSPKDAEANKPRRGRPPKATQELRSF